MQISGHILLVVEIYRMLHVGPTEQRVRNQS